MLRRICATLILILLAIGGFSGFADGHAGIFNLLGLMFLFAAVLVWRNWEIISGNFSPALFDGMVQGAPSSAGDEPVVAEIYPDKLHRRDPPR